ncbi:MAG: Cof-type HAD-IIB family hydrolase [Traorella sp.]
MIRVIFFDIDGTLLSHQTRQVPQSARKAIQALQEKGIHCVCATGRSILEIEELAVKDISFDAYITLNGQLILDKNKEYLDGCPLKEEEKQMIIQLFQEKETPVMLIEKDQIYMNFVNEYVRKAQADISTRVYPVKEYSGNDFYMVSVFVDQDHDQLFRERFSHCNVTRWHDLGLDVLSKEGGKVSGIKKYLALFGFSQEETMAFGDGENDMDMLIYASVGIAMGNASEMVKECADDVTSSIDDDGIYHALKKYELI